MKKHKDFLEACQFLCLCVCKELRFYKECFLPCQPGLVRLFNVSSLSWAVLTLLQCKHQSDLSRSHEACKTRVSDCQPWHMEQSEVGYSVRVSLSVQNKFMAKPDICESVATGTDAEKITDQLQLY